MTTAAFMRGAARFRLALFAASLAGGLAAALAAACGNSFAQADPTDTDSGDAQGESGSDAAPVPDPCQHVAPPPPPLTDDDPAPSKQLDPFIVAMSEYHLVPKGDAGGVLGYDLDDVCTCDTSEGAAHEGGGSCAGPRRCDADGGIDNGSLVLYDEFGTFVADIDKGAQVNDRIASGVLTALIEISNYNGRANDKEVNVGIIISYGIRDPRGCNSAAGGRGPSYPPGWCGGDIWSVDPAAVIGDLPPYAPALAASAYVTNHVLVVRDMNGYFEIPFGDTSFRFRAPIMTATIVPLDAAGNPRDPDAPPDGGKDGNFRLDDGILAGRLQTQSLLAGFGSLRVPGSADPDAAANQKYLCQSASFAVLRAAYCSARDIASNHQLDFDPRATCDAISTTTAFRARPAKAGEKAGAGDPPNPCLVKDGGNLDLYQCPGDPP